MTGCYEIELEAVSLIYRLFSFKLLTSSPTLLPCPILVLFYIYFLVAIG
jgi:hypothetical protein